MDNYLTEDTKTIILLCGFFGKDRTEKPLSLPEYTSLVRWLIGKKMRPADLLQKENLAEASIGSGIDKQRMEALLGRGVQLGFAVEEWQRNGIWIISRSDKDYPVRLKKHLKDKAPPLLFGVGDRALLKGGGLAIVGSRNVDREGEDFTRRVAELCAGNQMPVVSGGARGVDQISMATALESGGATIGILAENLLKKSLERNARHAIADGRLLLVSPYHPKARFTVGTAMGRNKLIYAMADFALVVSAEHQKGGTWAGAQEELKRELSLPVFVRIGNNAPKGNGKLLEMGAIPWPESIGRNGFRQKLSELAGQNRKKQNHSRNLNLFGFQAEPEDADTVQQKSTNETIAEESFTIEPERKNRECPESVYHAVLPIILKKLDNPTPPEDLAKSLDVNKTQLNAWLRKAVDENEVVKLSRPVRYRKKNSEFGSDLG